MKQYLMRNHCFYASHDALLENAGHFSLPFLSLAECPTELSFTSSLALIVHEKVRGMQTILSECFLPFTDDSA